jgi:hypothetical protein
MDEIKKEIIRMVNEGLCMMIDELDDIPYLTQLCKTNAKIDSEKENIFLQSYILENIGMTETNEQLKTTINEKLGETTIPQTIEDTKIQPLFILTGMSICLIILCMMIIGFIVFLIYMIYFTENGKEFVRSMRFTSEFGLKHPDSILKQYEFPIPPPPPPPPVNFVMDSSFTT